MSAVSFVIKVDQNILRETEMRSASCQYIYFKSIAEGSFRIAEKNRWKCIADTHNLQKQKTKKNTERLLSVSVKLFFS